MILYNVTVKIDTKVHEEWLQWMQTVHIIDVLRTGLFLDAQISRVLGQDESEGITYAIQYSCKDMATLQKYSTTYAPKLQVEHTERYKGKFVAFRTLLEVVDKFSVTKDEA